MKKKTQRLIVIILAVAMLLTVLVPALTILAGASENVTQDDINNIKGELDDISAQRAQVQSQLSAIRGDLSRAKEQVELVQSQIILTEQEITISQTLLDQYDLAIEQKEAEISDLEAQEAAQYAEFCSHVRWLEETGSVSYLSILFQAASFSELLDYAMLIADIMEYSNRIIADLEETQQELGIARAELQTTRDGQAEIHQNLQVQLTGLETLQLDAEALYASIAENEAELAAEAQALIQQERAIQAELKKAEEQYAAQIAALQNSGTWYWPLPGRYKLSSLFGGRRDPFTGRPSNHTGVDIPANSGTEIHAAQGGVVTLAQTNRYATTYGYYCIINHGNGKSTLYAHMKSAPLVKVGQTVTKGQVIGYVGSTGRSTGPHLHFELRIDGVRADALTLYDGMTFTSPGGATIKGG